MKDISVWILMFRDGDCFGSTQPMSKLECDVMSKQALDAGRLMHRIMINLVCILCGKFDKNLVQKGDMSFA